MPSLVPRPSIALGTRLQSCHTWLFVQQGHCSIPLMHGAVGDARCAVRQRAVDDGLPFGRRAVGDAWWAAPPTNYTEMHGPYSSGRITEGRVHTDQH